MKYEFREAFSAEDYARIRRLNHRIFAEEVGQHERHADGMLHDRYEEFSRFWIALHEGDVVAMVSAHDHAPFSVEKRLADPGMLDSIPGRKLEVRLLAVDPAHRNGMVFLGVLGRLLAAAIDGGYDVLLISGVVERVGLYHRMGFTDLGPAVPDGAASFVPMMMRVADGAERRDFEHWRRTRGPELW